MQELKLRSPWHKLRSPQLIKPQPWPHAPFATAYKAAALATCSTCSALNLDTAHILSVSSLYRLSYAAGDTVSREVAINENCWLHARHEQPQR
jgi:hypothetical protein